MALPENDCTIDKMLGMEKKPTKTELFHKKQSQMSDLELFELATQKLSKMCNTYGKSFTMSIPPKVDDDDMVFSELLSRFKKNVL